MNITEIWAMIEPYIMAIIGAITTGGIGAVLVRVMAGGWWKKHDLSQLSSSFADKLMGSKINIDLTAVTEKQINKIRDTLDKRLEIEDEKINSILVVQTDILDALKSSAKLTDTTKSKLLSDLNAVKATCKPLEA